MSARNSGELVEDVERFAGELQKAGVAFAIVIGIPGIRSMRYWTNLTRFGRPGLEEFSRQMDHLKNKVHDRMQRQKPDA